MAGIFREKLNYGGIFRGKDYALNLEGQHCPTDSSDSQAVLFELDL